MKIHNKYPIVPKKKKYEDILYSNKYDDEQLQRKQFINEIKERIHSSIINNDPAFIQALKMFLSEEEK